MRKVAWRIVRFLVHLVILTWCVVVVGAGLFQLAQIIAALV